MGFDVRSVDRGRTIDAGVPGQGVEEFVPDPLAAPSIKAIVDRRVGARRDRLRTPGAISNGRSDPESARSLQLRLEPDVAASNTLTFDPARSKLCARPEDGIRVSTASRQREDRIYDVRRRRSFTELAFAAFAIFLACSVTYFLGRAEGRQDLLSGRNGAQADSAGGERGTMRELQPKSAVAAVHAEPDPVPLVAPVHQTDIVQSEALPPPVVLYPLRNGR